MGKNRPVGVRIVKAGASRFITLAEREVLADLNRIIDWHNAAGKPIDHLLITPRQRKALNRLLARAKKGPVYDETSSIKLELPPDLSCVRYRDVILETQRPARRRYQRRDTVSFLD